MKFLNLGCGNRIIEGDEWINIDFKAFSPTVIEHNLLLGIPLGSYSVDFVYHSHVLEHMTKADGATFIGECFRVLKNGGIIRVAVPDLEMLVKCYLENLDKVLAGPSERTDADYRWSVIELLDQLVRTESGGEMKKYWQQDTITNEDLVRQRAGYEFVQYREAFLSARSAERQAPEPSKPHLLKRAAGKLRRMANRTPESSGQPVHFRERGEVHQWMYDRYSLTQLLKNAGFTDVAVTDAFNSRLEGWDKIRMLDVEAGKPRKPDSLFVEARK